MSRSEWVSRSLVFPRVLDISINYPSVSLWQRFALCHLSFRYQSGAPALRRISLWKSRRDRGHQAPGLRTHDLTMSWNFTMISIKFDKVIIIVLQLWLDASMTENFMSNPNIAISICAAFLLFFWYQSHTSASHYTTVMLIFHGYHYIHQHRMEISS